jgi:hypothetical protein
MVGAVRWSLSPRHREHPVSDVQPFADGPDSITVRPIRDDQRRATPRDSTANHRFDSIRPGPLQIKGRGWEQVEPRKENEATPVEGRKGEREQPLGGRMEGGEQERSKGWSPRRRSSREWGLRGPQYSTLGLLGSRTLQFCQEVYLKENTLVGPCHPTNIQKSPPNRGLELDKDTVTRPEVLHGGWRWKRGGRGGGGGSCQVRGQWLRWHNEVSPTGRRRSWKP